MTTPQKHLSDERLLDMCLAADPRRDGAPAAPAEEEHLDRCLACEERRLRLLVLLGEVHAVASAPADAYFTPERLERQRVRVLQRIEREVHHGRVIAFPAAHANPSPVRARPRMRWVAAAAAAGLMIGVAAGQFVSRAPVRATPTSAIVGAVDAPPDGLQLVSVPLTEDEFLGRMEMAIEGTAGAALRPLDDLTPLVWEVAAQ